MKRFLLPIMVPLFCAGFVGNALAGANCFAEYTVTNGKASEKFQLHWYFSDAGHLADDKIDQCTQQATTFINAIEFPTFEHTEGMCGTLIATGIAWLQMFPERIVIPEREVDVNCPAATR